MRDCAFKTLHSLNKRVFQEGPEGGGGGGGGGRLRIPFLSAIL